MLQSRNRKTIQTSTKTMPDYFKKYVEPDLKNAQTAGEMLFVLQSHYDLSKPLPMITHLAFRQGLKSAVTMLNPSPKNVQSIE